MQFSILTTKAEKDYELIDSGEGEKLERFGEVMISRPDPQALWQKNLPKEEWNKAQAVFSHDKEKSEANWKFNKKIPEQWDINFADLKFWIKPSTFKHVGIFPEQKGNWDWIRAACAKATASQGKIKVLNLFGYTGGATLAAAQAGAEVVHVDGSKTAITQAKENAELSGLADMPIRWILDDALVFVKREIKRGNMYDGIIMDPPAFGRGPDGQVWKIEEHFLELLEACKQILNPKPVFFLLNGYASGYSALAYKNSLDTLLSSYNGLTECGELTIEEQKSKRLLPAGIFARWKSHERE
ncbi:class I SAM-dependent methyltransferase [Candidatus Parcubacteria bacterium]|nr:class I SAM-dependent methyltransferase [Candidatus Parcubacteria bacterium]